MYGIAGERLTIRLREELFASMVQQEVAWFDRKCNNSGALCARLSGDASSVQAVSTYSPNELLNYVRVFSVCLLGNLATKVS
jgi:ATP-binding cassette subfamily B (MDR/TAP) protein 1